jgi:hypothetical protein
MRFEELVQQHRVHSFVANGVNYSVGIARGLRGSGSLLLRLQRRDVHLGLLVDVQRNRLVPSIEVSVLKLSSSYFNKSGRCR